MRYARFARTALGASDAVFQGTDIGRAPTPDHSRHVVLRLNFSAFNNALETLEQNFEHYCRIKFKSALAWHPDLFPEDVAQRLCAEPTINHKFMALFAHCRSHSIPLCILIDEYDNFANTVLAERGADAYHSFTQVGGFYRSFFATLKAGAETDSVDRLFITGVSPVTMDDVTSGFNIGANVSMMPEFNELLGWRGMANGAPSWTPWPRRARAHRHPRLPAGREGGAELARHLPPQRPRAAVGSLAAGCRFWQRAQPARRRLVAGTQPRFAFL